MKPRLNIVPGVKSLETSRDFYNNALGWEPTKDSDDKIVFYNHGGIVFGLYPMDKLAEDALLPNNNSGISPVALAINLDSKEAVDRLYKQVIENGATSLVEPRETFWGGYDCYFADPDGQHWEIAWAPFWKFDEKRSLIVE
ncbi:MAG: VOC family protein [Desulfobacterales bacterium]|nr:VOC family protein [Desulfobacterales bacterium]